MRIHELDEWLTSSEAVEGVVLRRILREVLENKEILMALADDLANLNNVVGQLQADLTAVQGLQVVTPDQEAQLQTAVATLGTIHDGLAAIAPH